MEAIQLLTESHLKQLIPKLGHRLKLQEYLNKRFSLNDSQSSESTVIIENIMDLDTSNLSQSSQDITVSPPAKKSRTDVCTRNMFRNSMDLQNFLESTHTGSALIKCYAATKKLSVTQRKTLVRLIADDLVENHSRITNAQYDDVTDQLLLIFPSELKGSYFLPPINGRKVAGGSLVERFRNQRRIINEASKYSPNVASSSIITEEDCDRLEWLKQVCEPWAKTVLYWQKTAASRRDNMPSTIHEYYETFPPLSMPLGYTLVSDSENDSYRNIYSTCSPLL